MGESQGVVGDRWTNNAVALLTKLGWEQRGAIRYDAPCRLHSRGKKAKHGLDAVMSYYNPYQQTMEGVFLETKSYAWGNFGLKHIQDWVNDLSEVIECAPYSEEFKDLFNRDGIPFDTGLLMINVNDDKYNHNKFKEYLEGLHLPRKNSNFKIFVAGYNDIIRFTSLSSRIEAIRQNKTISTFDIWYPSIEGSVLHKSNSLSLEALYSSYIFAKANYIIPKQNGAIDVQTQTIVFNFEKISSNSLSLLYNAIKDLQLEECSLMNIIIYDKWDDVRIIVEEFEREVNKELDGRYQLKIDYLPQVLPTR